jgi:hypothetical protein
MEKNLFLPAFGNRPSRIVGRENIISEFETGLSSQIGHPNRATLFVGQRGIGKTALLLELAVRAPESGFVVARVAASNVMLDEILQTIQRNGERYMPARKRKVKSVNAGALGFSFGLTFSDETEKKYGFRIKLTMLADELAKYNKGILVLVDEVQSNTPEMRELATTYQHLVGEEKNIAIAMAGLQPSISSVLNDDVLTFLNRAHKVTLEPIPLDDISTYYTSCFAETGKKINSRALERATYATRGYPYLLQLIGYYILEYAGKAKIITDEIVNRAITTSKRSLIDTIHKTCLKPLSDKDIEFLKAVAVDSENSKVADLRERMNVSNSYVQQYRMRLIEAGVIATERRGTVEFTVPYLGEYLRGEL